MHEMNARLSVSLECACYRQTSKLHFEAPHAGSI